MKLLTTLLTTLMLTLYVGSANSLELVQPPVGLSYLEMAEDEIDEGSVLFFNYGYFTGMALAMNNRCGFVPVGENSFAEFLSDTDKFAAFPYSTDRYHIAVGIYQALSEEGKLPCDTVIFSAALDGQKKALASGVSWVQANINDSH